MVMKLIKLILQFQILLNLQTPYTKWKNPVFQLLILD